MARLSLRTPEGEQKVYKLVAHQVVKIGRDPANDVVLRDPKVSRHHAEIIFEKGFFVLRDLASANGSYVNGQKIRVAPLTDGAEVRLGNSYGTFEEELSSEPGNTISAVLPRAIIDEDEPTPPPPPGSGPHERAAEPPLVIPLAPPLSAAAPEGSPAVIRTQLENQASARDMAAHARQMGSSAVDPRFRLHRYAIEGRSSDDIATITDEASKPLFYFRRQRNLVGFIAGLVASMIIVAGIVVSAVLFIDARNVPGAAALVLTVTFAFLILLLVPKRHAVICNDPSLGSVALFLWQESRLFIPSLRFSLRTPDNQPIAIFTKSVFSNAGRRRWWIIDRYGATRLGYAMEDSLARAILRKILGRFFIALRTNFRVIFGGRQLAFLDRTQGRRQLLDLTEDPTYVFDRRIALALAVLVDGIER